MHQVDSLCVFGKQILQYTHPFTARQRENNVTGQIDRYVHTYTCTQLDRATVFEGIHLESLSCNWQLFCSGHKSVFQ